MPEIREFERTSTTLANVYVQDLVERYLADLVERLERLGFGGRFFVMLSGGGIATVETRLALPRAAARVRARPRARSRRRRSRRPRGVDDLLSFDMGGTTAKLCAIEGGQPLVAEEFEVDRVYRLKKGSGLPLKVPVVDMIEIGAGGGSIARVSALGTLAVGPDSAGSDPGPACYGLGGTRADGHRRRPRARLPRRRRPSSAGGWRSTSTAARRAIEERLARPLGLSVEEAAWGVHQVVNENMANAARDARGRARPRPAGAAALRLRRRRAGARGGRRGGTAAPRP